MRISDWSSDVCSSDLILDRRRRIVSFAPDAIFAFVRWASNDFGTIISRIDIVRAIRTGEPHQTLPFVRPGGEILLRADGWPKVERVLQAIDAVEALDVAPADVAPDHWRHVHNRLTAGHRSEEHTSELQSLMRISYAVFCLKKKNANISQPKRT